ncbi:hypothetical protein ACWKSP_15865 [Micromonosporaceae bacterium Da 78-11]
MNGTPDGPVPAAPRKPGPPDWTAVEVVAATVAVLAALTGLSFTAYAESPPTVVRLLTLLTPMFAARLRRRGSSPALRIAQRVSPAAGLVLLQITWIGPGGWSGLGTCTLIELSACAIMVIFPARRADRSGDRAEARGSTRRLPYGLAGFSAWLAGPRRASDAETWRAHLLGDPDWQLPLSDHAQMRAALGFLGAALRMRGRDAANLLGRPLDWLVATESRAAALVLVAAVVPVLVLHRAGGWSRVWDDLEQVGVVAGFTAALVPSWRRIRDITPPRPKAPDQDP